MTSARRQSAVPEARRSAGPRRPEDLRRMVLLLETAAVLEARARRCGDPAQVPVLLRRAEHRRLEAGRLRQELAARGAALAPEQIDRSAATDSRRGPFMEASPAGRGSRS